MRKKIIAVWRFYVDGFRSMTLGRTLWLIILCKLFVMFFILKLFFFPNFLRHLPDDESKGNHVATELTERAAEDNR